MQGASLYTNRHKQRQHVALLNVSCTTHNADTPLRHQCIVLAVIELCLFYYNAGLLLKSFTSKLGETLHFQDVCCNGTVVPLY